MRILAIGDIVGRPGRRIVREKLAGLVAQESIDLVIANGENAAGGSGITPVIAEELYASGVDILTTGDHIWKKKEIIPYLDSTERIVRPANYPDEAAGRGYTTITLGGKPPVAVINLLGRTFMRPIDCPFHQVDRILSELQSDLNVIIVDFHAEATSEKVAMGWHLDGRVTAVLGTHTHVPTADERVTAAGTACITDLGMTGPYASVIGRRTDRVLAALMTSMPFPFDVATDDVRLAGAIVTMDPATGRAIEIERIQVRE